MERSDIPAVVAAIVLTAAWGLLAFYNLALEAGKILRMNSAGPSPVVIVGSVCGISALLVLPGLSWIHFIVLLPAALLPDLAWVGGSLLFRWRKRRRT